MIIKDERVLKGQAHIEGKKVTVEYIKDFIKNGWHDLDIIDLFGLTLQELQEVKDYE